MGTNFYYKLGHPPTTKVHIGKRISTGAKETKFIFNANCPYNIIVGLAQKEYPYPCVENEYGKEYTAKEFLDLVDGCFTYDWVEEDFC